MQPLFCAVIQARDALQGKQTGNSHGQLVIVGMRIGGSAVIEALALVVVVQKGDEVAADLTVGADQAAQNLLALFENIGDSLRRPHALDNRRQLEEQREV